MKDIVNIQLLFPRERRLCGLSMFLSCSVDSFILIAVINIVTKMKPKVGRVYSDF